MLKPEFTGQFKRDYKLAVKRGCNPKKLEEVITLLCNEQPLPEAYRDHALTNSRNYKDMRECHIEPDWLLVYKVVRETLILKLIRNSGRMWRVRTGGQSVVSAKPCFERCERKFRNQRKPKKPLYISII